MIPSDNPKQQGEYRYIKHSCDCTQKFEPIKHTIVELVVYFCLKCKKQMSMEFE